MKALIVILFALGLTVVNKPAYLEKIDVNNRQIEVVFDESLKFNDLVAIKLKLESRNIFITYDHMEFNSKGQLRDLSYQLNNKNDYREVVLVNKVGKVASSSL